MGPRPAAALTGLLTAVLLVAGCGTSRTAPSSPAPSTSTAQPAASASAAPTDPETLPVQIELTAAGTVLGATLADTDAARALLAQLPLELVIEDVGGAEKVGALPRPIPGPTPGLAPRAGDVAFFAPTGNLVLYYRDGTPSDALVPLGRLDTDPAPLADLADGTVVRIAVP